MKDLGKELSGKLPQTRKKLIWKKSLFFLILNPVLTHKLPSLFLGMEKKIPSCFDKNSTYSTWNRLPSLPNPVFLGHLLSSGWHPCSRASFQRFFPGFKAPWPVGWNCWKLEDPKLWQFEPKKQKKENQKFGSPWVERNPWHWALHPSSKSWNFLWMRLAFGAWFGPCFPRGVSKEKCWNSGMRAEPWSQPQPWIPAPKTLLRFKTSFPKDFGMSWEEGQEQRGGKEQGISSMGRKLEIWDKGINPSTLLREEILDLGRANIGIFPFCASLSWFYIQIFGIIF